MLRRRFVSPRPRLDEARWLTGVGVNSGLDISDGLAGDASHLAAASGVAVVLDAATVPLDPGIEGLRLPHAVTALDLALHGGDDFEILVSAPALQKPGRGDEFQNRFGVPLSQVGRVAEGMGVWLESRGAEAPRPIVLGGYDHFGGGDGS
jgi:thiamine-monophosphate kinase